VAESRSVNTVASCDASPIRAFLVQKSRGPNPNPLRAMLSKIRAFLAQKSHYPQTKPQSPSVTSVPCVRCFPRFAHFSHGSHTIHKPNPNPPP
jgi:hypothetical protein